jgi:hypothetical protein
VPPLKQNRVFEVFSKEVKIERKLICSRAHRRGLKNLLNWISSADLIV